MKIIICNAFSLSMLNVEDQRGTPSGYVPSPADVPRTARIPRPLEDAQDARKMLEQAESFGLDILSAVGHADTAALFSTILGRDIPANRASVKLDDETILLVGQYTGPRLPEGTTELPAGATIVWWRV